MKRLYLQRLLKVTALILPITLIVCFSQNYLFRFEDGNTLRLEKFYLEEEDSLDMILLGASEVHHGYAPGYAYTKYGYTSYVYSIDGNISSLYLPQLKEVLSYQDPQLILVDVGGFSRGARLEEQISLIRKFTESIPPSANQLETLVNFDYDDKASFFFPFIKYHGDLDLAKNRLAYYFRYPDFFDSPALLKGTSTHTVAYSGLNDADLANISDEELDAQSEEHLLDLLDFCQEKKLDNVVFVNFPRHIASQDDKNLMEKIDQIQERITDYGYDFVNLQNKAKDIGLSVPQDFSSPHHLNICGQQKLTEYIGHVAVDEYHLTPREQTEENEAHWEDCADLTDKYFDIAEKQLDAGNTVFIGTDTDILPYLDDETTDLVDQIHEDYDEKQETAE